ncbi:MAG TPA: NAD(P)/FAD-dependent oxidoreductase [Vicinamibacterales bacterium]|jgi:flavin-dependent dehydrogenase|nr:NAD(P)/FAD-dependent oxidoreductase [Vicinamibacterales bacterium]
MLDVLIVGAGPAGSVAGTILARAGARVRIVDRAAFPRDKLCGDTVNPGTLARLEALNLAAGIAERGLRIDGMRVTCEGGVAVEGRYPGGASGRAITRRDLDWLLLQQAVAAGCQFDPGVAVRGAMVGEQGGVRSVSGVVLSASGGGAPLAARVTIAADGRHSTIAFGLRLARHPPSPRRWAIGAYFENFMPNGVTSDLKVRPSGQTSWSDRLTSTLGEMHVRRGHYIGIAPVPGGLTNVCLVKPSFAGDAALGDPTSLMTRALARDPLLRDRAAGARLIGSPAVLGPLAVEVRDAAIDGLLLAGDAGGFIDPMTGDGLRFAVQGGELAAAAALQALWRGWAGVHAHLAATRRRAFGSKWMFNRGIRAVVASPLGVQAAAVGALIAPPLMRAVISHAGDC